MVCFVRISITILFVILFSYSAESQPLHDISDDTLRVGLVLSGGGAKGIAHIGILKAIEEAGLRVDYITGTSMGSLVGGLYAIGYTSDQLSQIVRSSNWDTLFRERANRRFISNYEKGHDSRTIISFPVSGRGIELPTGILTGQNISTFLSRLSWHTHGIEHFDDFPIPFAAVATELATGEARVFRSGYLPDAIRASISVPSAMAPHQIDGTLYIDGGLSRNLPAQDALDMGANYIIAVDVSRPLMEQDSLLSLTSIMHQAIGYRINDKSKDQRALADLLIIPGDVNLYSMADFDQSEIFLEIGERAGNMYIDEFKRIAAMQNSPPASRAVTAPAAIPISNVFITGNTLLDDAFLLEQLEFIPGVELSPDILEEKITELYSSRFYDQVTYKIEPDTLPGTYNLHINIQENTTDDFRIGLRYETRSQASILLESNFRNLLHPGSVTRFDLRVGDHIRFITDHIYYGAMGSRLALLSSLQYHAENVDWYREDSRVSRYTSHTVRGELSGGNYFSSQHLIALGLRKDFIFHTNEINPEQVEPTQKDYHAGFFRYKLDRLNRTGYPTAGQKVVGEIVHSDPFFFSPIKFTSISLFWKGMVELHDSFSLKNSLYLGYTDGDELPWSYWNVPNRFHPLYGFIRFAGFDRYTITSRNLQLASAGLQAEPFYHRFISVDLYAGRVLDTWNIDLTQGDLDFGISLSIGALSILGPMQLILATSSQNSIRAELQIGYQF